MNPINENTPLSSQEASFKFLSSESARQYVTAKAQKYIPANVRKYTWSTYTDEVRYNSLGGVSYLSDQTGTVVDMDEDFALIKIARSHFAVVAKHLLDKPVAVGDKLSLSFYKLRRFDGTSADGSDDPAVGSVRTCMLTGIYTHFPVKWEGRHLGINEKFAESYQVISNPYLRDLIVQMENISINDGRRAVVNVLVDAGAQNLSFSDPGEDDVLTNPPGIHCDVKTAKFEGRVSVVYDRGMDTYTVLLSKDGVVQSESQDVHFNELGEALTRAIDDGHWLKAKVTVLKPAPKGRKPKVETA